GRRAARRGAPTGDAARRVFRDQGHRKLPRLRFGAGGSRGRGCRQQPHALLDSADSLLHAAPGLVPAPAPLRAALAHGRAFALGSIPRGDGPLHDAQLHDRAGSEGSRAGDRHQAPPAPRRRRHLGSRVSVARDPLAAHAAGPPALRERMSELDALFRRHVAQTSAAPLGLEITHAEGSTVTDRRGRTYLDFLSGMGVANVGHGHPDVVAAVQEQAARYLHAMVYGEYVEEPQVRLAARLAAMLPAPLSMVYFVNSGAEAIEGALKTARKYTGRAKLVAFEGAFHGDTLGALSLGG